MIVVRFNIDVVIQSIAFIARFRNNKQFLDLLHTFADNLHIY